MDTFLIQKCQTRLYDSETDELSQLPVSFSRGGPGSQLDRYVLKISRTGYFSGVNVGFLISPYWESYRDCAVFLFLFFRFDYCLLRFRVSPLTSVWLLVKRPVPRTALKRASSSSSESSSTALPSSSLLILSAVRIYSFVSSFISSYVVQSVSSQVDSTPNFSLLTAN